MKWEVIHPCLNVYDSMGDLVVSFAQKNNMQVNMNPYPEALPDSVQQQLADRYASFFQAFVNHPDIIDRVTFCGVCDEFSWLNDWPIAGRTNYPLLFGRDGKPKPACYSVIDTAKYTMN